MLKSKDVSVYISTVYIHGFGIYMQKRKQLTVNYYGCLYLIKTMGCETFLVGGLCHSILKFGKSPC